MAKNPTKMTSRYLVTGRVQGVGFRYWVVGRARHHRLVGWVRNRRDGRVEVVAYGDREILDVLERELAGGPPAAMVTAVEPAPVTPEEAELAARATAFEQTETV
ncbi:acylphosphatase [Ferrovibrio sp.]|uniref:acylphosphatase n=1 Tax=Ferrovibrio sp. TaxID=1917215 RepID=UPI00311E945E